MSIGNYDHLVIGKKGGLNEYDISQALEQEACSFRIEDVYVREYPIFPDKYYIRFEHDLDSDSSSFLSVIVCDSEGNSINEIKEGKINPNSVKLVISKKPHSLRTHQRRSDRIIRQALLADSMLMEYYNDEEKNEAIAVILRVINLHI